MTLYRQLVLMITALFLLMFAGTWLANLSSTRQFLQDQLASHAQDTATSLGLSLSPHMAKGDLPTMEAMISAVSDRGYYRLVRLQEADGKLLVERRAEMTIESVPHWFVTWVPLEVPQAEAVVMSGWAQAGKVVVESHPGYAYRELWGVVVRMLGWFAVAAALVALLAGFGLKALMRPLSRVEAQARAISERRFEIQERLPRTRELRRVVAAMNRMALRLKSLFEEQAATVERLREQVYQDGVTGLGNRRYLESSVESHMRDKEGVPRGTLILLQINNLQAINDSQGFSEGDEWLCSVAATLERQARTLVNPVAARIAGGDFALLLPGVDADKAERIARRLCADVADMRAHEVTKSDDICHLGGVVYHSEVALGDLLAEADLALQAARRKGPNSWHLLQMEAEQHEVVRGKEAWKRLLGDVVRQRDMELYVQDIVECRNPEVVLHREVLARMPRPGSGIWSAGGFYPMAERVGLASSLDRLVMEKVLVLCAAGDARFSRLGVNLSFASLRDEAFRRWLVEQLDAMPATRTQLIFEFSEYGVSRHLSLLQELSAALQARGHGLGVDHFGRGFSNFGYLRTLRPEYVKIDRIYTDSLVEAEEESRFFISSICALAHSLEIQVIAEGVEHQAQWDILKKLNVDGAQGYLIGRPQPQR